MNQTHLPSDFVVDDFLFLYCCCYNGYCLTKNIAPKFLSQNRNKNINKIRANLYST